MSQFFSSARRGWLHRALVVGALGVLTALSGCGSDDDAPVLLVGNTRGNNVVKLDAQSGRYLGDFIAAGSGGLTDPDDLTYGPDGHLYVSSGSNTGGQILRFDGKSGAFLGVFAQGGGMMRPYGSAFGPDGHLYVASFRSDQILKFNGSTGAFMAVVAQGDGTAQGLLNGPNDLLFGSDGRLYVTTQGSVADGAGGIDYRFDSQVLRYDVSTGIGEVFAPAPAPTPGGGGYVSFLGLAAGPDGLLYTTDFAGGIRSYDPASKALRQTIDTGALFGGGIATTIGNLSFADGRLFAPVFNADDSGVLSNGLAQCDVAAAVCRLVATDNQHLARPIGVALAR